MSKVMTSEEFVKRSMHFLDFPTVYVNGAFGAIASDSNKKRYCNSANITRWNKIKTCPSNGYFTDCCGLPKGVLWGWNGENKIYGGAEYKANGVPDLNELGLINACENVSTDFSHILKGELVYMKGHCGIYVGDGLVLESTPSWSCGVQLTGLGNVNKTYNGKTRKWLSHGRLPWVEYAEQPTKKYDLEQFRTDVRTILGVKTNQEAFNKAVTISKKKNKNNALVTPLERYFKSIGYYSGEIEADKNQKPDFGAGMDSATKLYQRYVVKATERNIDGELTKGGDTWKKLLLG